MRLFRTWVGRRSGWMVTGVALALAARPVAVAAVGPRPPSFRPQTFQTGPGIDVVSRALRSVVIVGTRDALGREEWATGFAADTAGTVVTTRHSVVRAEDIRVRFPDGVVVDADLLGADVESDVALLRVDRRTTPLPFALTREIVVGMDAWVLGTPLGSGVQVSRGIVSALPDSSTSGKGVGNHLVVDAVVDRGSSGGPVVDAGGRLIGMVVGKAVVGQHVLSLGLAIPSDTIREAMAGIRQRAASEPGWIGVVTQGISAALAQALGLPSPEGVVVVDTDPSGPAAEARIFPGSVITAVHGTAVRSPEELETIIRATPPGTPLALATIRGGHAEIVAVRVDRLPLDPRTRRPARDEVSLRVSTFPVIGLTAVLPANPDDSRGALVVRVEPGGPAARAGLLPGDLIDWVDGVAATRRALEARLAAAESTIGAIAVRVRRDGRPRLTAIEIGVP